MSLLEVTNLKKIYTTRFGGNKVQALTNVNFSVEKGEFVAIMGESGSGKTTLLNILATLDKPTSGDVLLDGKSLVHLSDKEISTFRRKNLVLADEPTGALDSKAANALLDVFGEINRQGQTILMVTHSAQAASRASRVLFIKDGEVFHQIYRGEKTKEEMYQMISDTLTILMTGGEYHA